MDRLISEKAVLDILENGLKYGEHYYSLPQLIEMIKVIPSAEPKEVYYSGDGYADGEMVYDMANCPNCDCTFEESDEIWGCNYCPHCGQALKWEGEQDEVNS